MASINRFVNAWRRHRWGIFGPVIIHNVSYYGRRLLSTGRLSTGKKSEVDGIPGVETNRAVYLSALGFVGESGDDAQPYEPITDANFRAVIDAIPIEPHGYAFVDLGSGKGRALLLASKAGFRRVVGVEYSAELHQAAQKNLQAARSRWPNVDRIELLCGDAAEFVPPSGPVVCYMFNPFGPAVMSRVIKTWSKEMSEHDHDVWVVYGNPTQAALFNAASAFEFLFNVSDFAVYRRRSDSVRRAD